MPRARIFFVCGEAAETMWIASDGPAADGSWAAREELAGRATQEERHARGVREKGRGLFWGKIGGVFACPPGGVEVGA